MVTDFLCEYYTAVCPSILLCLKLISCTRWDEWLKDITLNSELSSQSFSQCTHPRDYICCVSYWHVQFPPPSQISTQNKELKRQSKMLLDLQGPNPPDITKMNLDLDEKEDSMEDYHQEQSEMIQSESLIKFEI